MTCKNPVREMTYVFVGTLNFAQSINPEHYSSTTDSFR